VLVDPYSDSLLSSLYLHVKSTAFAGGQPVSMCRLPEITRKKNSLGYGF